MTRRPTYQADIETRDFRGGSRLVYGTSGLGGVWGKVDPKESVKCLLHAWEQGIRSIDTSPSYSESEAIVGQALRHWRGERPFISTKVGRLKSATAFDAKVDYTREGMTRSVHRSLELLGVDTVDLLFLHEPQWVPLEQMDEIMDTLMGFKANGLTTRLGIGGNPPPAFEPYFQEFDVISTFCRLDACNLSAFDREMDLYRENRLSVYAASSLHFGLLGKRLNEFLNDPPKDNPHLTRKDLDRAEQVQDIARKHAMELSSLAQRYLFSIAEADRVVMGACTMTELDSTLADWRAGALPPAIFEEITDTII